MITSTDKISDKASSGKDIQTEINMWALEYQGPEKKGYVQKKKPILLKTTDAIVKMTKTTICGTDLHIMKGMEMELSENK